MSHLKRDNKKASGNKVRFKSFVLIFTLFFKFSSFQKSKAGNKIEVLDWFQDTYAVHCNSIFYSSLYTKAVLLSVKCYLKYKS